MYFRQILHSDLGCASYLLADQGQAVVIDPKWEIDEYLQAAGEAQAEIRHVVETHNHADHVSGRHRLAALTGARVHVPSDGGRPGLSDGDVLHVGRVSVVALATPGHRPEHLSYLVHNGSAPRRLLCGDSLLVGDVARPDLAVPAREGAQDLWDTLRRLGALDDDVEVWPAHVGGSLCASRQASGATRSTIGQERLHNPLLRIPDPKTFSAELTRRIPARPPTMERVLELNRHGVSDPGPLRELDAAGLCTLASGTCLLDTRDPERFDSAHLAGAINLAVAGQGLGTRAGWAVCGEQPIVLLSPSLDEAVQAAELLRAAGVWNLAGLSVADPAAWIAAGLPVRSAAALGPHELAARVAAGAVMLLDVRDPAEWDGGHIPGSVSLPLSELRDGQDTAALKPPLATICASGVRAALAASILRRRGHDPVFRAAGGVADLAELVLSPAGEPS
jgi:hydroxyacylglutathione hydrolase